MSQPDGAVANAAADPSPSAPPRPPPVEWPEDDQLTREWVAGLTATLDWCSRHLPADQLPTVLPAPLVQRLVLRAASGLHQEPNLVRIDPRPGQSVVVVGDVHGQLHDVIFLLQDAGFPSEERLFVFNGDYVDRGAWGVETFLLLLAWKLTGIKRLPTVLLPNCVFLLRGNHESKYCTSVYGFEKEVMTKFKDQGPPVYRKFLRCFEDLPLATIIAGCVYTAHGGVFRGTIVLPSKRTKKGKKGRKYKADSTVDSTAIKLGSLDELLKARRTVLDPPWEGPNLIPGDVLWSDPSLELGLSPNNERGIGLLWGPDITQQFLRTNNLKLIIRSHEGPDARDKRHDLLGMDKGYTIDHDGECGKLITLFSAPDYPQFQASEDRYNNCGAYIVLNPPDFATPIFRSFEAVKPRPAAHPFYDFEEVIDSDEELNLDAMDSSTSTVTRTVKCLRVFVVMDVAGYLDLETCHTNIGEVSSMLEPFTVPFAFEDVLIADEKLNEMCIRGKDEERISNSPSERTSSFKMMASSSIAFLIPATARPPAGAVNVTSRSPPSVRMWCDDRARSQLRLVAAAVKRRYKGTVRKEAALAELIERKVAEAMEACGEEKDEGCRVAWDEVEELSQAKADLRRRIAEAPDDPLEPFCAHNPTADDCAVVYVDD
ncbi:hypothetical protein EJB05_48321 [Eragrostis curvula]|uniref:Serine/threonine-protein phosphatase n=1 Tax=Eragrostis curvula TaxID=38414 RepID=A0A5J9T2N2_9POAL|nr:hypothetical protein EJB05_48321 [Eragrostis curvula]